MAAIFIKQKKWEKCLDVTEKLQEVDEKNIKCMYRRAQALIEVNSFECAERLCKEIKEFDPTLKEVPFIFIYKKIG